MAHILVVGGAGGVGSAVVAKLLARGDSVSVSVLNDAEEAAVRSGNPGVGAIYRLDLSNADSVRDDLKAALGDDAAIDAVLVAAAISPYGPTETAPLSLLRRTLEINCISDVAVYQAVMPALRRSRGRIVFISSMAGEVGFPFIGAYVTSKFALEGAADTMRREAKPQGVDVVLVQPGGIKTPMVANQIESLTTDIAALGAEEAALYGHLYRAFQAMARKDYEGGASQPEQIADVVVTALTVAEPQSRYIAGPDAEELIAFNKGSGDAAVDAMFADTIAKAVPA